MNRKRGVADPRRKKPKDSVTLTGGEIKAVDTNAPVMKKDSSFGAAEHWLSFAGPVPVTTRTLVL